MMVSGKVTVIDDTGLHMKPAGILCKKAVKYKSTIKIKNESGIYNAKSVLSVLGACVRNGDEIELVCDGPDEQEALEALTYDISHKLYKDELM
jgi:phosphocarrier protein